MKHITTIKTTTSISKYLSMAFVMILLLSFVLFTNHVVAATESSYYNDKTQLLTSSEASDIELKLIKFEENYQFPIYIFTIPSSNGDTNSHYLSTLADQMQVDDAILILVNMDPSNRELIMQSYGSIQDNITPSRLQQANDSVIEYFADGEYYEGFKRIISLMEHYTTTPESVDSLLFHPLVQLGICLVIALIVISILVANSKGKVTTTATTYLDEGRSRVIGRHDHYINTTYVRTKRESNNSNGGGGGSSGTSSGGRSFSESSNKF